MAKHSFEFKKCCLYLDGKGGMQYLSKNMDLAPDSQLLKCGLMPTMYLVMKG